MKIMEMLGQSGLITLFGMGVVFGFLILMIIAISIVGKIINTIEEKRGTALLASAVSVSGTQNAEVTAVISAAVNQYRKNNSR